MILIYYHIVVYKLLSTRIEWTLLGCKQLSFKKKKHVFGGVFFKKMKERGYNFELTFRELTKMR